MSLILKNITVGYGDKIIMDDFSLEVGKGQVFGIAGINGAGKSTTLKTIAGILPLLSGEIELNGFAPKTPFEKEEYKNKLGYCPDVGGVISVATPREHINLLLNLNRDSKDENQLVYAERLIQEVNLQDVIDSPAGSFSHGMLRRLSVALASLNAKELLVLDEPFDGVDPTGVKRILEIVERHRQEGKIVLISSHLIDVLAEVSDTILVMVDGHVVAKEKGSKFKGVAGLRHYKKLLKVD